LGEIIHGKFKKRAILPITVFLIIGIMGFSYAVYNQFWKLRIPTTAKESAEGVPVYPVGAVRYLRDINFSGNLMVPFNSGAYVSWNLYPQVKVSLDSRFEAAYPVDSLAENINFYAGEEGWQGTLARYRTDMILVPRWSKLDGLMEPKQIGSNNDPINWSRVYLDDGYSLYIRSNYPKNYPYRDMRGKSVPVEFP
jgi:hypothetical protein